MIRWLRSEWKAGELPMDLAYLAIILSGIGAAVAQAVANLRVR